VIQKFGNRVEGAEPEKEGSPTSNRLWACSATRSHCWEFCCLARDDVGLAVWIFQVNRWEKISRKVFEFRNQRLKM